MCGEKVQRPRDTEQMRWGQALKVGWSHFLASGLCKSLVEIIFLFSFWFVQSLIKREIPGLSSFSHWILSTKNEVLLFLLNQSRRFLLQLRAHPSFTTFCRGHSQWARASHVGQAGGRAGPRYHRSVHFTQPMTCTEWVLNKCSLN